jgi:PIN domain nuclease of toxin-antitoxin system
MANLGVEVLPIDGSHVLGVLGLPDHHRDPSDRLLIAQCQAEQLVFLSGDEVARRYAVEVLW